MEAEQQNLHAACNWNYFGGFGMALDIDFKWHNKPKLK